MELSSQLFCDCGAGMIRWDENSIVFGKGGKRGQGAVDEDLPAMTMSADNDICGQDYFHFDDETNAWVRRGFYRE
jgi:hypothetical protein